jgi:hypothetical protein
VDRQTGDPWVDSPEALLATMRIATVRSEGSNTLDNSAYPSEDRAYIRRDFARQILSVRRKSQRLPHSSVKSGDVPFVRQRMAKFDQHRAAQTFDN